MKHPTAWAAKKWDGERLRKWREKQDPLGPERRDGDNHLLQWEAAALAGVSERTWRRYEDTNPPLWLVRLIETGGIFK